MQTLPGYFLLLFLSVLLTFTFAQTDLSPFISSPNKFTSRSFSQPEASSGTRADVPTGRRNAFLPPPDRLSPTVRPILFNQGVSSPSTTTSKPVLSRFHPSGPSKFSAATSSAAKPDKTKNNDEYEDVYYYDYYYDDENATTTSTTSTPLSDIVALNNKFKNNPTGFSKFHSGNFRTREETLQPKVQDTTKSLPRFRFSSVDYSDRVTRPSVVASTSSRTGSLRDLIAQLKSNVNQNENPSSNFVDSNREGKQYVRPRDPVLSSEVKYRTTNTTESTFATGSVISSQSIKDRPLLSSATPLTTEAPFQTKFVTVDSTFEADVLQTDASIHSRKDGKRILDDTPSEDNLTENFPGPEGPPTTNSFPSLFENIHIAVDPSLFPPGYSVDETITETTPEEPEDPSYKSKTAAPDEFRSTLESIFSTLPQEDITSFLPPGFVTSTATESTFTLQIDDKSKITSTEKAVVEVNQVDPLSFLPPGYKPTKESIAEKELPGGIVKNIDVSAFLPPGYKPKEEAEKAENESLAENPLPGILVKNVDASKFLPPSFKSEENKKNDPLPGQKVLNADVSKFLPPGYSSKPQIDNTTLTDIISTIKKTGPSGIVFPRRPKRPEFLTTTTTTTKPRISGPPPLKPKIQNLFDRVKALGITEYTVPVVTENSKSVSSADIKESTTASTTTTTTTTTTTQSTTTTPPRPTTPGICGSKCRLAASLRLISGTEWHPELANRDTLEFQELANVIETELDAFFRSSFIAPWYEFVEVDSFNRGSVIVSYILSLSHIQADIDTKDLKERLNTDLERVAHSLGNFTVDPAGTDFIVIPEQQVYVQEDSQNFLIPEWLIAVIVIGLASFLFIIIFGVVALVSRARVRKRANVPLTEEFLNNLNALQVNGIDNYAMNGLYDMDPMWNEKFQEKAMKPPSSHGKGYNPEYNVNIYDSWRTDYSGPYTSSSGNHSKKRTELDFDGKQFYKDDPYDF